MDQTAKAKTPAWTRGTVIEDRWGLRWRADTRIPSGGEGWQCRSVGLRIFRTDEQMAERGPLKFIRLDQVFAGGAAKAARQAGEAEDARVTVDGDAAEGDCTVTASREEGNQEGESLCADTPFTQ